MILATFWIFVSASPMASIAAWTRLTASRYFAFVASISSAIATSVSFASRSS